MRAKSIDHFAKFQLVDIGGSEMSALASLLMDGRVANLDHPATRLIQNIHRPVITCGPSRVPFAEIRKARESFSRVEGRLERKGEKRGVLVIGNCAHHFTKIGAALRSFRRRRGLETGRKIP